MIKQVLFIAILFSAVLVAGCSKTEQPVLPHARPLTDRVFERTAEKISRGKYLTEGVCQCFICHSERDWNKPGAPPMLEKKGGGRIIDEDSLERFVAPNITPDKETGAGTWTDDMFARAIREGIGHDGRALAGPMWYWAFANLSDEDVASVVVYLRTLPPVHNPLPKRRFSAKREESIKKEPKPILVPVPVRDMPNEIERGKYLVHIADCAGCHTAWEAPLVPGVFGGGNLIEEKGKRIGYNLFSANLTSDPSGIAYYDDSLFIEVIRTGRVRAREIDPAMPWFVFQNMTDADLRSVFAFLRAQPPVRHVIDNHIEPTKCPMCGQEHGEGEYNVSKFETFEHLEIDSTLLDQFAGTYEGESFNITVRRKGNHLFDVDDDRVIEMVAGKDSSFYAREYPGFVNFMRDKNGNVTHVVSHEEKEYILRRVR